ncbi:hypothetical protein D3C71_994370 [compost metagenome]
MTSRTLLLLKILAFTFFFARLYFAASKAICIFWDSKRSKAAGILDSLKETVIFLLSNCPYAPEAKSISADTIERNRPTNDVLIINLISFCVTYCLNFINLYAYIISLKLLYILFIPSPNGT